MAGQRFLAVCWGCYECGDPNRIVGRYATAEEAQVAANAVDMGRSWVGDRAVVDLEPPGGFDGESINTEATNQ